MNIWNMNKTSGIKAMLIALTSELEQDQFTVDLSDKWGDSGVYLCHKDEPELRAYIYTTGQATDRYGVDLEYPRRHHPVALTEKYEDIDYSFLKNVLCTHLNLL